jgi:hypothetical protein
MQFERGGFGHAEKAGHQPREARVDCAGKARARTIRALPVGHTTAKFFNRKRATRGLTGFRRSGMVASVSSDQGGKRMAAQITVYTNVG